jgi:hypothetical protein
VIVTAALAWYDEPVELLDACVRGLAGVADRVVAVDGVYRRFPHQRESSPPEQAAAIAAAAMDIGIESVVVTPARAWAGQVEKRSALLREASVGSDWIMVVDADHIVHADGPAAREELSTIDADVVSVPLFTPENADRDLGSSAATNWHAGMAGTRIDIGHFFRALPDLHVERFHWWYTATRNGAPVWFWYGEGTPSGGEILMPRRMTARYEVEHRCLLRDEHHVLANRAFCNDRKLVVEMTGQEDDQPGLPAPVYDYETLPY